MNTETTTETRNVNKALRETAVRLLGHVGDVEGKSPIRSWTEEQMVADAQDLLPHERKATRAAYRLGHAIWISDNQKINLDDREDILSRAIVQYHGEVYARIQALQCGLEDAIALLTDPSILQKSCAGDMMRRSNNE